MDPNDAIRLAETVAKMLGLTAVGKPAIEAGVGLVRKLVEPSVDAAGKGLAAPIDRWAQARHERAMKVVEVSGAKLVESGVEPIPVPPKLLLHLLREASLEEDEDLQEKWATLLANSATENSKVLPAFVEILRQLTPAHARVLDWMFQNRDVVDGYAMYPHIFDDGEFVESLTLSRELGDLVLLDLERVGILETAKNHIRNAFDSPRSASSDRSQSLSATQLRVLSEIVRQLNGDDWVALKLTALGRRFLDACYEVRPAASPEEGAAPSER